MTTTPTSFTAADGDLLIHTGVAGPAARTGHRLTIAVRDWNAEVAWSGGTPTAVDATIVVDSLEVIAGEGGLTPMAGPERGIARGNALKSLNAKKFGEITFHAPSVTATPTGYTLDGQLTIAGKSRPTTVDLAVDGTHITFDTTLTQSDFGVKPYSLAMGTLKVADEVRLTLDVTAS